MKSYIPKIDVDKLLKEKVESTFNLAIERTKNNYPLKKIHRVLKECHQRINAPMRVAIIGEIKSGKSTLFNALLEEDLVPTGTLETTFNINHFIYENPPKILIHFKDGRIPEKRDFKELKYLTERNNIDNSYLNEIRCLEVFYPNKKLETFHLIDTPGLNSSYQKDSENTKNFLEASSADAIIYVFRSSLERQGYETIKKYQNNHISPINAIGILSKIDEFISDRTIQDPLVKGEEIAKRLLKDNGLDKNLYSIIPVCGKLALGVATLQQSHWKIIEELVQMEESQFNRLTRRDDIFQGDEPQLKISKKDREELIEKLSLYGIKNIYQVSQSGTKDREEIKAYLREKSGISKVDNLIISHFGNRAFLIKLENAIQEVKSCYFKERNRLQGKALILAEEIATEFDTIYAEEHAFSELRVLKKLYQGKLEFSHESIEEIEQITGERGISLEERLGLENGASIEKIVSVCRQRVKEWYKKANTSLPSNRATLEAARSIARSYERLLCDIFQNRELEEIENESFRSVR